MSDSNLLHNLQLDRLYSAQLLAEQGINWAAQRSTTLPQCNKPVNALLQPGPGQWRPLCQHHHAAAADQLLHTAVQCRSHECGCTHPVAWFDITVECHTVGNGLR